MKNITTCTTYDLKSLQFQMTSAHVKAKKNTKIAAKKQILISKPKQLKKLKII